MTVDVGLPDPTDLDRLRSRLAVGDAARRRQLGMRRIEIGTDALDQLEGAVRQVRAAGPVVALMDATPMRRGGEDLKRSVTARLEAAFDARVHVLGRDRAELHADEQALAEADRAIAGAGCVVAVGSGTVTDIAKDASHRAGDVPFVVVQTAVSVNAFSDDMAVLLRDGVKRTVPSRWPDVLLVDLQVIADAPPAMNRAGFGELCSMFTAPADWLLAGALGLDATVDPDIIALFRDGAETLFDEAPRVAAGEPEALAELARRMTLTGIAMGVAGRTAPLSGTEHLVSHLIDMAAAAAGRPLAFHGAQVGVASVIAALAWDHVIDGFDAGRLLRDDAFPDPQAVRAAVHRAFAPVDPSGRMGEECWRDVRRKLERWGAARAGVQATASRWDAVISRIRPLVADAERLATALRQAGSAVGFGELDPHSPPDVVRWALGAVPLMRDRFTVVDLLWLTGSWDEAFVEQLLARHAELAVQA